MPDASYGPKSFIFASKGISARIALDRIPEGGYVNLKGCAERYEESMSSRGGSQIVNRDPDGTGEGVNYLLPFPISTLTRLKYNAATWRYAGSGPDLYRRTGNTQGPYSVIYEALSGQPFGSASTNCFASSQPYLFIADQYGMIKDSGTGIPTQWGITPPNQPANAIEYAPLVLLIDGFTSSTGSYSLTNISGWGAVGIGTVIAAASTTVNNFQAYTGAMGLTYAFNGALGVDMSGIESLLFNIYSTPNPPQFSGYGVTGTLPSGADTFTLTGYSGSIAANTTGSIGKTVDLDLSQNYQVTDDDLICFAMNLSDPAGISQINIQFDINNSGYTSSYYTKAVSPAYYQSGIDGNTDAYTTASDQILALSLGLLTGTNTSSVTDPTVSQLQSSTANTGQGAWSTVYSRRGDFLPVGNAGEPGFDWSSVTGWRIQVVTTTNSSVSIGCNGLYLQWGAGPSSFGGVGYDYRYIYFNANTQTPSNPSQICQFSQQFGFVPSYQAPIVLRQAIGVYGQLSSDPQVTHVRIYRRGGTMNTNWFYLDQIPNVTSGGQFQYIDIIPDMNLLQSDILQLDNDAPITSSLQNPIVTELSSVVAGPGMSPYDFFSPQTVTVTSSDTFLQNQLVVVGTPQNLEQVSVVTGGVGEFTAVLRLTHAAGEQVQVFSIPQQPCDLVELAYGQLWVAGDPNNPHFLYYSKPGYPENFSPQNYIPCGSPSSPIMAVINDRGTLFVATLTTWYQIVPGNPPYAQQTGSRHGLVSKTGWTKVEGGVWYQAIDGLRDFRGADGTYKSLPIEWIFRDIPETPIPLVDNSLLSTVTMGFRNTKVFTAYTALDGTRNRLIWSENYSRFRNDDVPATAFFYEADINVLLYAKQLGSGWAICEEGVNDYDDGGWVSGALVETPINMDCQLPYQDLGAPHFPKQWNTVELDADTNGQDVTVILNFDDGIAPLTLGVANTTERQKIQFDVLSGDGQQSYKCSPELTAAVTAAPQIYQLNVYADTLAANRASLDSYWMKFGTDTSKICRQVYLDYTSTAPITLNFYTDGSMVPYYTFTLPPNQNRAVIRVRLPALKFRTWRMIVLSDAPMQTWSAPRVEYKPILASSGFSVVEVTT